MSERVTTTTVHHGTRDEVHVHPEATIQIKLLREGAKMPERLSPGASGWDVAACLDVDQVLMNAYVVGPDRALRICAGDWAVIPLGFALALPPGWEMQLRPRSGLAAREGVVGYFGTIDSDYRGECCMILFVSALAVSGFRVQHGDRIGQAVFQRVPQVELVQVDRLSDTDRSNAGFGSTGR